MSALRMESVSKTLGREARAVEAVREASLEVTAGEVLLLEGPSGSGKTTLLSLAAGLLTPDSGSVTLHGEKTSELSPGRLRAHRGKSVGFVFQRANLLEGLTVLENVEIAGRIAGLDSAEARSRGLALLEELGIGELTARRPEELSGGEEHRVALARALIHEPAVVLADEPTGNLDSRSGGAVSRALASLARRRGAAVVIATHDARLHGIATRRVYMEDGRLRGGGAE